MPSRGCTRRYEGGASHPAAHCHEGAGEQQKPWPADEDEAIAFQPVVESIKYASCWLRAPYCYGHKLKDLQGL